MLEFYGRSEELALLEKMWLAIELKARMAVITGRRRIGKTLLSMVYAKNKPHIYLFVAKKNEVLLCQEFMEQIKGKFDFPVIGEMTTFRQILTLLLEIGKKQPFVLIIDEIQEFFTINPSIFSEMQELWDRYLFESKVQLILMGSVYSLMHKIFEDAKEPLFGRADRIIRLKPFLISELNKILKKSKKCTRENELNTLFTYYLITGGVPKYIEQFLTEAVFEEQEIFDFVLSEHSPFLEEGKSVLIEEFGKDYGTYFSILELMATGKTSRGEIESILQKDIGGYLDRLENHYNIIAKFRPIIAKPRSRMVKYRITDLFLRFWFCFIFNHWSAVEAGNFSYLKQVLAHRLPSYKGPILEIFFKNLFAESHQFNLIGSYWEHDNSNEIDLVAVNDFEKKIVVAEIKHNKECIRLGALKQKSEKLLTSYPGYHAEFTALSLKDADNYLQANN